MGSTAHHLDRSRHYLNFVVPNVVAGDYPRAARALCRSATHAVTAAAVHCRRPYHTRRHLHIVLDMLMFDGLVGYTHQRTFRQVHQLTRRCPDAWRDPSARRDLRRARRRVAALINAVTAATAARPAPLTLDTVTARYYDTQPHNRPTLAEYHAVAPSYCNNRAPSPGAGIIPYDPACSACAYRVAHPPLALRNKSPSPTKGEGQILNADGQRKSVRIENYLSQSP